MDGDDLVEATRRWVEAGLIDEETGAALIDFERQRTSAAGPFSTDRVTAAVAIMGGLLVGVGVLVALAASWDDLGDLSRTGILLSAPLIAATSGLWLDRRHITRAGSALWILAILLLGPSIFLLADIHVAELGEQWVFLAWGLLSLPMGHAFRTRIGTAVGIASLLVTVVLIDSAATGAMAASILGTVVGIGAIRLRDRVPQLVESYRVLTVAPLIILLLWLATVQGDFGTVSLAMAGTLGGSLIVGITSTGVAWSWTRPGRATRAEASLVTVPLVSVLVAIGLVTVGDPLPPLAGLLLTQLLLLVTLLGIIVVGVGLTSAWLVNLVAVGFLGQVITLLTTLADDLSGAFALIVVGVILLFVAAVLERGRRRLLARFVDESGPPGGDREG